MDRFAVLVVFIVVSEFASYQAKPTIEGVPTAKMSPKCGMKNFCTHKPDNYPDDVITALLSNIINSFKPHTSMGNRLGGNDTVTDPQDECRSRSTIDPIYLIKDVKGYTRFVVQAEKFKQIIALEECETPGKLSTPTRNLSYMHLNAYQMSCYQCRLNFGFLVLSLNGTSLETVAVKGGLPTCCACKMGEAKEATNDY